MKYCYLLFLVFIPAVLFSQLVIIQGEAISYKHDELVVFQYHDFISFNEKELARVRVAEDGTFRLMFPLETTGWIYLKAGVFRGILLAEPDSAYQIVLPVKVEKTIQDILNPFFEEQEFYITTIPEDPKRLTNQMSEFEFLYNQYLNENFLEVYQKARRSNIDTVIQNIEKLFSGISSPYFSAHRYYRYASLKYFAYQRNDKFVIKEYFLHKPVLYSNRAYFDLFNKLFVNYFSFYSETAEGSRLVSDISYAKSPYRIRQTLSNNLALANDTLRDLVLLKGLHDAFYKTDFPDQALFQITDSLMVSLKNTQHTAMLKQIKWKVCQLRKNFPAPDLALTDVDGKTRKLSDFKNKNLYLNFYRYESFTCLKDLELLKNLYKKIGNQVEIVTINCGSDFQKVKQMFKDEKYEWTLLQLQEANDLEKYKIKAYPSYFFVHSNGTFIFSPSPGPGENFEWHSFNYLKSQRK